MKFSRLFACAAIVAATPASAFEYSLTSGGNGYVTHVTGVCADKSCSHGAVHARQDCDVSADPQKCPVAYSGTFVQAHPGCYHITSVWTMKDGRKFPVDGYRTANGGMCESGG